MYPYHNMIKKRIKQGELIRIQKIKDEDFAFVFIFSCHPYSRPIRHHAVSKYKSILSEYSHLISQ